MTIESSFIAAKPIVKSIIEITDLFGMECDNKQLSSSLNPIIVNAIFDRDKRILESERWETIRVLSATLTKVLFDDTILALRFTLTKQL